MESVEAPINTIPKLWLSSLPIPSKVHDQPAPPAAAAGMSTPPVHALASVPFQWEEAPGKPKPCNITTRTKPKMARCLDLPPRLLQLSNKKNENESQVTNMPSPTTVLDGPDHVGRSLSFGLGRSLFSSSHDLGGRKINKEMFGRSLSSRWGIKFRKNNQDVVQMKNQAVVHVGGSNNNNNNNNSNSNVTGADAKVKITRMRRRSSFLHFYSTGSHLRSSICDSFKQVVPWRRRQERLIKEKS